MHSDVTSCLQSSGIYFRGSIGYVLVGWSTITTLLLSVNVCFLAYDTSLSLQGG